MKKLIKSKATKEFLEELGKQYAKDLTTNSTKWEIQFKKILQDLHYKFQFQVPKVLKIKGGYKLYIVDFLLEQFPLAIEIDGISIHNTKQGKKRDASRTKLLKKEGLDVLRFTNSQVSTMTKKEINDIIQFRIQNYC